MTAMRLAYAVRSGLFLVLVTIMLAGCAQGLAQEFADMSSLHDQLVQNYHHNDIDVRITNGNRIDISFVNSGFNNLPTHAEKQARAREIAQFVKDRYAGISHIDTITVSFTVHIDIIVFQYTNNLDTFSFETAD